MSWLPRLRLVSSGCPASSACGLWKGQTLAQHLKKLKVSWLLVPPGLSVLTAEVRVIEP